MALLRLVQAVQQMPLLIQRPLGGVEVLGGLVLERPPPEPQDPASVIDQREHEPAAKAIVGLARLADQQTGVLQLPVGEPLLGRPAVEPSPFVRREAHPERPADLLPQPALLQVLSRRATAFCFPEEALDKTWPPSRAASSRRASRSLRPGSGPPPLRTPPARRSARPVARWPRRTRGSPSARRSGRRRRPLRSRSSSRGPSRRSP